MSARVNHKKSFLYDVVLETKYKNQRARLHSKGTKQIYCSSADISFTKGGLSFLLVVVILRDRTMVIRLLDLAWGQNCKSSFSPWSTPFHSIDKDTPRKCHSHSGAWNDGSFLLLLINTKHCASVETVVTTGSTATSGGGVGGTEGILPGIKCNVGVSSTFQCQINGKSIVLICQGCLIFVVHKSCSTYKEKRRANLY